ncbi:MAG: phage virion morphogenesis protein [Vulcanimicrobiota bacterium]
MAKIVIDLDEGPYKNLVAKLSAKLSDLTAVMRDIGNRAIRVVTNKFRVEGPGWEPLKESTLARRRQKGTGANILRDDGDLYQSVVYGPLSVTSNEVTIGSNLPYARIHQLGGIITQKRRATGKKTGRRRRGSPGGPVRIRIPARPYLPNADELRPEIERVMRGHLEDL